MDISKNNPSINPIWIEDDGKELPTRLESDDFKAYEPRSFKTTIVKRLSENMLVPIGLIATTACLTFGLINLSRGDSRRQQFYMRGRVLFQSLTFLAMTSGALLTALKKQKN